MARQMGARSQLLAKLEGTYGTAPSGNWQQMPVLTYEPGMANDIIDDPVIGFGTREQQDPFRGPIDVKGGISVPVDVRNIGLWLKCLTGNYSVTGSGPYTHVFKAENTNNDLLSLSCELGHLDAGQYFLHTGLVINKGTFDFTASGAPKLTLDAIAQNEANAQATVGGTPTQLVYKPFSQLQGQVFTGTTGSASPATAIANIVAAKLEIDNQVEATYGVGTAGKIIGADPTQFKVTGSVTVRFADVTLYDDAVNQTFVGLSFGYNIDSNDSLTLVLPRVSLGRATPKLTGPKGIQVEFPFQASRDPTNSATLIATLINPDVVTY